MKVTEHIHVLKIPFQVPIAPDRALHRSVYVYIIDGDGRALMDTGVAASEEIIYQHIRSLGREPEDISAILLTHSHPDHIGSACRIKKRTGCEVMAHPAERDWIEDTDKQVRDRPVPGFDVLVAGPVKIDREIGDGEVVDLAKLRAHIMHTPGHSHGSVSVHMPDEGALITGDAVPVPGDLPIYDDALAQLRSIERLKEVKDAQVLLSAWDEPRTNVQEVLDHGLEQVRRVHRAVLDRSPCEPFTPQACSEFLVSLGLPPAAANPLIVRTIAAHLSQRNAPELLAH